MRWFLFVVMGLFALGSAAARQDSGVFTSEAQNDSSVSSLDYLGSFGGTVSAQVRHGKIGVASMGSCVEILDCSDAAHPKRLARRRMKGEVTSLDFTDKALYLADRDGIQILDITDPARPRDRGHYAPVGPDSSWREYDLKIKARNILVINGTYSRGKTSLEAVDIRNLWNPESIVISRDPDVYGGNEEAEKKIQAVLEKGEPYHDDLLDYNPPFEGVQNIIPLPGHRCCINLDGKLTTLDLTDPDRPKILGSLPMQKSYGIVRDKTLIVDNSTGIQFIDIGDVTRPVLISTIPTTESFAVDWPRILVSYGEEGLTFYDLTDLKNPRQAGRFKTPHPCRDVEIANHRAYVACLDLQIVNLTDPARPALEGIVKCEDPEMAQYQKYYEEFRARDVRVCGHYIYCESACIDVADPRSPRIVKKDALAPRDVEDGPNVHTGPIRVCGKWGVQDSETISRTGDLVDAEMKIFDLSDPVNPKPVYSRNDWDEGHGFIDGYRFYLVGAKSGVSVFKWNPPQAPPRTQ